MIPFSLRIIFIDLILLWLIGFLLYRLQILLAENADLKKKIEMLMASSRDDYENKQENI